jgi:hypothetical protein
MGLGQAEQLCTLCVEMYSSCSSPVQLPGASLASVEVSLTLLEKFGKDRYAHRYTAVFIDLLPQVKNTIQLYTFIEAKE